MKELSVEEKAKRYDEALKVLHKYDGANIMFSQSLKEEMFPELKESEDERIRKEMIFYFTEEIPQCSIREHADKMKEFIAWLEKQGEQKPEWTPMDEQRVKNLLAIVEGHGYPGEVAWLNSLKNRVQPKQDEQKPIIEMISAEESLGIDSETYNKIVDECIFGEQKPVEIVKWSPQEESCICQLESLVKEQWRQAERVHNSVNIKKMSELMFFLKTLNPNKKSIAWSEKDNTFFKAIIRDIENIQYISEDAKKDRINWLESIKDRVQPQPMQEWSGEEIETCAREAEDNNCIILAKHIRQLKSLRPQSTWKPSDEQMSVLNEVINYAANSELQHWSSFIYTLLKSLREQLKKLREE